MNNIDAVSVFEALASPVRLAAFRRLVQAGRQGLVAGELADALDIAPSNLSFHLKGLAVAGLIESEQEGRYQRYRANLPLMLATIGFLTENCCGGTDASCVPPTLEGLCAPVTRTEEESR